MNKYWKIRPDSKKFSFKAESFDVENTYETYVKWDGCIELIKYFNGEKEDCDQIHICDLDDFILRLQELRDLGAKYFNNEEWK